MGKIRPGYCNEPGPYEAHCTNQKWHRYSCYDSGEDVSFNDRQDFIHSCIDVDCDRQQFENEGD